MRDKVSRSPNQIDEILSVCGEYQIGYIKSPQLPRRSKRSGGAYISVRRTGKSERASERMDGHVDIHINPGVPHIEEKKKKKKAIARQISSRRDICVR